MPVGGEGGTGGFGFEFETGDWKTGGGAVEGSGGGHGSGGDFEPPFIPTELLELIVQSLGQAPEGYGPRRRKMGSGPARGMERVPIPAYAYGTRYHPGGPAMVGEQGPEVVNLPRGASVQPNPATRASGGWAGRFRERTADVPGPSTYTPGTIPGTHGWTERENLRDSDATLGGLIGPGGFSLPQFLQHLTAQGVRGGIFDPLGSQALAGMTRDSVSASSGARERAGQLGADLDSGGDPALRAFARTSARLNTQSEASKAYLDAIMRSALQNQGFLQQLFGGPIAGAATRKDQPQPNPWAQAAGLIGGAALGGLIPGGGAPAGAGSQSQIPSPYDTWSW